MYLIVFTSEKANDIVNISWRVEGKPDRDLIAKIFALSNKKGNHDHKKTLLL